MCRFLKFLVVSIIIVTLSFGIYKFSNRYDLSIIYKNVDWSINTKGLEGAVSFDFDKENNLYIAFNVLASFIPYWLMYGARKKTKNPITIAQIMLKKATERIVLNKLLYSPFELYIAARWEIAAIIPAVIKQIKRLYTGITKP